MKLSENHQQQSFHENGNDEAGGDIKTSEAEYDAVVVSGKVKRPV